MPSGQVWLPLAYAEWILLGASGLALAAVLNRPFLFAGLFLLVMGMIYNVPPVRSKELPYLDVLSEAINNPIRLLLGARICQCGRAHESLLELAETDVTTTLGA